MKTQKWMIPLGMVGVLSFLLLTNLGRILWPGYNPVTTYISALVAQEAPNAELMQVFFNIYNICFCLYALAMAAHIFQCYHICAKLGYALLFVLSFVGLLGYGGCPISLELVFSANDIIHILVTIVLLSATILALLLIAIGYLKQDAMRALGRFTLVIWGLFTLFNLWHLYAILSGQTILGLIQRLSVYTVHLFTFTISWIYTFKRRWLCRVE